MDRLDRIHCAYFIFLNLIKKVYFTITDIIFKFEITLKGNDCVVGLC